MKRILSFVLILVMVLGLLAGCGAKPVEPAAGASVEDAKTYLYAMYKEDNGTIARRDFKMVSVVMIDGVSFPIEWTTDSADYVTIGAPENNMVTIDIVEDPTEQVTFKLIATLKDAAGNTASVEITRVIEAVAASGVEFAATPVAGTAYKFAVVQNNLGETIYFTGEMSGYYLATSANPFDAVDVFVEDVEGGQRLYFMNGEVKTYIDIVPRGEDNPGKVNVVLTEAPTCVYTWDSERKTYVTNTVADNTWYLGCYNTYNTMSASNTSYIEDVTKIGDSQFPAGLCTVNIAATQVSAPVADTAYKFAVVQNNLGQTIYFTGEMSGYYLATSNNPAEGVNVFVENVDGGIRLYFMKGDVKTYIDVVSRGDGSGKVNVVLTEAPTCVYTWDAERKTYTTAVEGSTWYLGCYNTYNTMSASNTSYIEDVTKIGDSQFPAGPYIVEGFMDLQPTFEAETPVDPDPTPSTEPEKPAEVTVPATLAEQIAAANKLANKELLPYESTITGTITDDPQASSKNEGCYKFTVSDGTNSLLCYFVPVTGGTPKKGDTITVTGKLTAYNGAAQFSEANSVATLASSNEPAAEPSKEPEKPAEVTVPATLAEQIAEANKLANKEFLPYESTITGTITDDPQASSKNEGCYKFTVSDGTNSLLCYFVPVTGGTPKKGDTVTVTGKLTAYNGKAQFKESAAAATWISAGESVEVTAPTDPAEIVDAAYALEAGASLPYEASLTGMITEIRDPYSEQYKNITVTITVAGSEDQPIVCFRLKGEGAENLVVGDVITVTGSLMNYGGMIEFNSGCTFTK